MFILSPRRGNLLSSGAGGDVGVGYAVLIFEWLTRVARGSNFF